ncbi:MAG: hypothetical protein DYG94_01580 [Leptolyngbya sp. PLA3]|nr:MAG: hypothetical protein EDM82_00305 [Cyanobacteria bacterium CYA]MCE7967422.1 hypothetical protein [Leptolyngbya sp. PL-A3]
MTGRGYAMPLVFLLSLVVALVLGLAIERNTAQVHNVKRQLEAYRSHHIARGFQEAISAWLSQQNSRSIAQSLGEGGHAIDLSLPDGSVIAVYLRDGQGTILDPQAASSDNAEKAASLRVRVQQLCAEQELDYENYQRPLGPFSISINVADPLVLQAVAEEVVGLDRAPEMVNKLIERRSETGQLERQDVLGVGTEMGLDTETRNALMEYFTVSPEMWYVTIELRGGAGMSNRALRARYGGLVPIRSSTNRTTGAWEQPGVFLTWEELSVEYDEPGEIEP